MRPLWHFGSCGTALLALLMATVGPVAVAGAAMPDCRMMAPAGDCHGCGPPGLQTDHGCCDVTADQPAVPARSQQTPVDSVVADVPGAAGHSLSAPAPRRPLPGGPPPLSRPAGRALLTLQQTFLI